MKKNTMNKKYFWVILRSVSLEMVVMALVFGGAGYGVGAAFDFKRVVCMGVGGIVGIMLALVSVWRRIRMYLRD